MIFLDTSAIYALADGRDPKHVQAKDRFASILGSGHDLLTHNYVLVEAVALLQNRLGLPSAHRLASETQAFAIQWIDEATHSEAVSRWTRARKRSASLVDHVSFLVMRRRGVRTAFAFDHHFEEEGFAVYGERG